jgi:hypothetical protein
VPVEVAVGLDPAEEDVARGLHQLLALDHTPAVAAELTPEGWRLEHRRLCLLDLQEQGVVLVPPLRKEDPAACPDAADSDDLAGEIDILEPLEERAPVGSKRLGVPTEELA